LCTREFNRAGLPPTARPGLGSVLERRRKCRLLLPAWLSCANRSNITIIYYVEARPELSDREYDRLIAELRQIETEHPELASATSPLNE